MIGNFIWETLTRPMLNGVAVGALLVTLFAIGWGAATAISSQVAEYAKWKAGNQRGRIECVNGGVHLENMDIINLDRPLDLDLCGPTHGDAYIHIPRATSTVPLACATHNGPGTPAEIIPSGSGYLYTCR
jgi:hypothetical protein